jgi:hypothetical protein
LQNVDDTWGRRKCHDLAPDAVFDLVDGGSAQGTKAAPQPRGEPQFRVRLVTSADASAKGFRQRGYGIALGNDRREACFEIESSLDEERVSDIEEYRRWWSH